ncbi:precorrin-6A synthase (deacetylating) [Leisingera sp. HS039]|uniref:precorrin-6A synthase (deacetylating) n=1 Tax=unclassified Leisingera TaxID=2614906 RepID=UPI0010711188|nr:MULTISPECIES: precorrin-6A synthase (deacetylating) [unclassified Leisingera]MBQ4824687.1 precorrin-6A synthase (deacetylating) [Leisingera sp. HS039]QBR38376.1 precorrin-6A synthase (deacetylating) [Leisingera sp. NJS201]
MIELSLIGIGTGNPQHMTLQAIDALNAQDLILIPNKGAGKDDLAGLRRAICNRAFKGDGPKIVEFALPVRDEATQSYRQRVDDWHDAIAGIWWQTITANLPAGGKAGFLVWGDPSLYDSTMRIAERLKTQADIKLTVIPGITSVQALTAAHAIPVNEIGAPFTITTGRQLREAGWPDSANTLVVMLDGECSFQSIDAQGVEIFWTAYAGMENQISVAGPLAEVAEQIIETRAKARAEHGWIMDIYLLRKT